MSGAAEIAFLDRTTGDRLAYRFTPGAAPTVVFLGGFLSDMEGTKATALEAHCGKRGRAFLRFDYSGHGASAGRFEEGTISSWRDDVLAVIDAVVEGPIVLVGSSMGGWIAFLVALARRERVAGLIGIAAAPDFTEEMMWESLDAGQRRALEDTGQIHLPSAYDEPYPITRRLIEDGRKNLLLAGPIDLDVPVRLLQGAEDPDVPGDMPRQIADRLVSENVEIFIIEGGAHNLSRESDIHSILSVLDDLLAKLHAD